MAYDKIFLRGGAEIKEFDRGKVIKVGVNFDDLVEKVRTKELRLTDSGTLYFDILEKKPEKQKSGESTHYLVQSKKVADGEAKAQPTATNDDLPF